ncbi:hypothetical protein [uncultured Sphingomonas sp.]|uniref:hypothetical protein n=1 Tax=uncultured Sphingomonas sp. TaxID=158754 RepID=UPI0025E2F18C|nr:hypothetical protein [uncultured Sphingomonas sp.]
MTRAHSHRLRIVIAALVLFGLSLAVFAPGYVEYDSVGQYEQALTGQYDDWHPPIMARLWSLFVHHGAGPMLALQLAAWWLGLGALAAGIVDRRPRGALLVLAVGLVPPWLGWQVAILKDAQMTGAALAAVGIIGWWRLRDRRVPPGGWVAAGVLLAYAALVRANAIFAIAPLVALLVAERWRGRIAITIALTLATLALAPLVNHRLLGAASSGVARTQALYDLAGIAVRVPYDDRLGLSPTEVAEIRAKECVKPFFWDPLGDETRCGTLLKRFETVPPGQLYARLAPAILHHPIAYAEQRLAHVNSTWRLWVPSHWPNANPPEASEPNDDHLGTPGQVALAWQRMATPWVDWPVMWPVVWLVLGAGGLAVTRGNGLAGALFGSAIGLEASFLVISVASDFRYHLWAIIACALGLILAKPWRGDRRIVWATGAVLLMVLIVGTVARLTLPVSPQSYQGMLG